jgi:LysR family transcriptional regulator, glycine cleavage system transcriptional activator
MNSPHVNTAMQNRTSIKSIQAFEAAARLGSFAVAAEELAVTPSAVSHQIKLLEEQLGVTLFHRVHRAVVLTEAGRHYANEVIAAFARIEAATRNVAVAGISTVLTVHSTPSFASQWLMRRLARFGEMHPELDIRLHASLIPVDLNQGNVDVDIRYNPGPPSAGTVMVSFPDDKIVPMCSPSLASGIKPIYRPDDLAQHTLIHSEITILGWRDWARRHRKVRLDLERGPRFDRSFMAISAAVDGLGVCLDSLLLAEQELRAGKLIIPFAGDVMTVQGHGFVTLRSKTDLPKIRSFREWLFEELSKTHEWADQFMATGMSNPKH